MSQLTISQKVEQELSSKKAEEIETLDLSDCSAESFEGLTDKLINLKELIANGCGLKTCDGLPVLKHLVSVDLSNNEIRDLKAIAALPQLTVLELCNNGIEKIETLEPLFNHTKLESLSLDGNEVKNSENFLETLFQNLPVLVAVDGVNDKNGSTFFENGEDYDEEYDSDASNSNSEDDEVGLEALENSGELEDDEEDFNPEAEDDEEDYDDDVDDEEDDDEEANHVEEKLGKKRKAETNGSAATKQARVSEANGDDSE